MVYAIAATRRTDMVDEVELKRTIKNINVLIDSIEINEVKHAMQAMLHIILALSERIDELQDAEDE
jgi:hypothetical protein